MKFTLAISTLAASAGFAAAFGPAFVPQT